MEKVTLRYFTTIDVKGDSVILSAHSNGISTPTIFMVNITNFESVPHSDQNIVFPSYDKGRAIRYTAINNYVQVSMEMINSADNKNIDDIFKSSYSILNSHTMGNTQAYVTIDDTPHSIALLYDKRMVTNLPDKVRNMIKSIELYEGAIVIHYDGTGKYKVDSAYGISKVIHLNLGKVFKKIPLRTRVISYILARFKSIKFKTFCLNLDRANATDHYYDPVRDRKKF